MRTYTFQQFWDAYGLKRDRLAAERAWKRLGVKDKTAAIKGIVAYCEDCEKRGIAMMYGEGYLNHRRWEDELESNSSPTPQQTSLFPELPTQSTQQQQTPIPDMDTW